MTTHRRRSTTINTTTGTHKPKRRSGPARRNTFAEVPASEPAGAIVEESYLLDEVGLAMCAQSDCPFRAVCSATVEGSGLKTPLLAAQIDARLLTVAVACVTRRTGMFQGDE